MAHPAHAIDFTAGSSAYGAGSMSSSHGAAICERHDRPVDLVHLSRQSHGDRELEIEILGLFQCQSKLYLDRLVEGTTADQRKMAAHTILGSARGIGAWKVADEAEHVQADPQNIRDFGALRRAVEEANHYIASILADV